MVITHKIAYKDLPVTVEARDGSETTLTYKLPMLVHNPDDPKAGQHIGECCRLEFEEWGDSDSEPEQQEAAAKRSRSKGMFVLG